MMITKKGLIIMTTFSIIYAFLELGMYWNPARPGDPSIWLKYIFSTSLSDYFYRILYFLIFSYPSYLASGKLISLETLWYLIYGSAVEDIAYWIIAFTPPYSWAWFYPVYYGIPFDDVLEIVIVFILYLFIKKE